MLSRCFIEKSRDYERVLRSRRRAFAGGWKLCCVSNAPLSAARFAVVVAKRHVRSAVSRNLIRRRLREYFRQELQGSLPPMDYLMCTTGRQPLQIDNLRADCRELFALLANK